MRGTEEIMCSHMLTPEELSGVVLQMSVNTLRGSMIPAAQRLFIWVGGASGGRVSICLPTHFILCDDEEVNWTRSKETDEEFFFLTWIACMHISTVFCSVLTLNQSMSTHILLLFSLRLRLSLPAFTEVVSVHEEKPIAWSLGLRWEKRVNFLVYQSQPI